MSTHPANQSSVPTFEALSQHAKPFSEAFVLNALNNNLETVPGAKAISIKSYFDHVPADQSDREFFSDPDKIAAFRDQASDFIASHLRIFVGPTVSPENKRTLKLDKDYFVTSTLDSHKQTARQYLYDLQNGLRPKLPRVAYGYQGLRATGPGGNRVDLLHTSLPDMRANIWVQDQIFSQFVQWRSDQFVRAKANNRDTEITRRIYLNPEPSQAISIFGQIVDRAQADDLLVAGKFLDRYTDGLTGLSRVANGGEPEKTYRGDGIVFYANEASANTLLSIAEDVYKANYPAFQGRKLSKAPLRIGEGVGVGDEVPGTSLTANRAKVLEEVMQALRTELGLDYEKINHNDQRKQRIITGFNTIWARMAAENGIDPHNLAFNKK